MEMQREEMLYIVLDSSVNDDNVLWEIVTGIADATGDMTVLGMLAVLEASMLEERLDPVDFGLALDYLGQNYDWYRELGDTWLIFELDV